MMPMMMSTQPAVCRLKTDVFVVTAKARIAPTAINAAVALGGAAPMKVLVNTELQNKSGANASERSTRHIEVQLPSGASYRVGDHLSVVPRNDPALVDSVARRFGFLPADQIRLQVAEGRRAQLPVGDTVSVGRLLSEFVELQQVATRKQIQIMSENTRCPVTKPKLLAYVGDEAAATALYRAEILGKRKSVGIFHSMSGRTAMKHALEAGFRWDALVLFDPPNMPPSSHPLFPMMQTFEGRLIEFARNRLHLGIQVIQKVQH